MPLNSWVAFEAVASGVELRFGGGVVAVVGMGPFATTMAPLGSDPSSKKRLPAESNARSPKKLVPTLGIGRSTVAHDAHDGRVGQRIEGADRRQIAQELGVVVEAVDRVDRSGDDFPSVQVPVWKGVTVLVTAL